MLLFRSFFFFFFNDTATTEIYTLLYTLSLHDALPIGGGPEPSRQLQPEQHDGPHDDAHAQAVTDGPRDPQPAGIEQLALARGEGRDRGQMIGLEGVTEAQQQAEARQGEEARVHRRGNLATLAAAAQPRHFPTFRA